MISPKAQILARLQQEILPLQGYKPWASDLCFDGGLGIIKHAFPNASFPLGAVHEFFSDGYEDSSATSGFIMGILSSLIKNTGAALWISPSRLIFPPALTLFGINPEKVIFVEVVKEKDRLWAIEEALKCEGLTAVIADTSEISFTASRRLQLAVEQSHVTGFIIRRKPKNMATACVTRWRVTPLPGILKDDLPGLSFPRWNVELIKVRNGIPGNWQLQWANGSFSHEYKLVSISKMPQRKAV